MPANIIPAQDTAPTVVFSLDFDGYSCLEHYYPDTTPKKDPVNIFPRAEWLVNAYTCALYGTPSTVKFCFDKNEEPSDLNQDDLLKKFTFLRQIKLAQDEKRTIKILIGSNRQTLFADYDNTYSLRAVDLRVLSCKKSLDLLQKVIHDSKFSVSTHRVDDFVDKDIQNQDSNSNGNTGILVTRKPQADFARENCANGRVMWHDAIIPSGAKTWQTLLKSDEFSPNMLTHEVISRYGDYFLASQGKPAENDTSKIIQTLFQMHAISAMNPQENITFGFGDDRKDITENLHRFFTAQPHLIPKNITLNITLKESPGQDSTKYLQISGIGNTIELDQMAQYMKNTYQSYGEIYDEISNSGIPSELGRLRDPAPLEKSAVLSAFRPAKENFIIDYCRSRKVSPFNIVHRARVFYLRRFLLPKLSLEDLDKVAQRVLSSSTTTTKDIGVLIKSLNSVKSIQSDEAYGDKNRLASRITSKIKNDSTPDILGTLEDLDHRHLYELDYHADRETLDKLKVRIQTMQQEAQRSSSSIVPSDGSPTEILSDPSEPPH